MGAFENALLIRDVRYDDYVKTKQLESAKKARKNEEKIKSLLKGVGKVIGGTLFGPAGMFLGDALSIGADFLMKSENKKVGNGKFNMDIAKDLNRQLENYDRSVNVGNVLGIAETGLQAFGASGGMRALGDKEGFGAILNKDYWTKWDGGKGGLVNFVNSGGKVSDYFKYLSNKPFSAENSGFTSSKVLGTAVPTSENLRIGKTFSLGEPVYNSLETNLFKLKGL